MSKQKLFKVLYRDTSHKRIFIWADDLDEARKLIEGQFNPKAEAFDPYLDFDSEEEITDMPAILDLCDDSHNFKMKVKPCSHYDEPEICSGCKKLDECPWKR